MKVLPSLVLLAAATLGISTAQAGEHIGGTLPPTSPLSPNDESSSIIIGDARAITGDGGGASWTEIVVSLRTTKPAPLHGRVEIYERYDRYDSIERMVDQRDVDFPARASGSNTIHIPVLASRTYHVRFVDDKRTHFEWHGTVAPHTAGYGSLVFNYREPTNTRVAFPERHDVNVVSLEAMPRSAWTYDRTALFIVDATMLGDKVDEPACSALFDWMRSGGTLAVVSANGNDNDETTPRCGREPMQAQTIGGAGRLVHVNHDLIELHPSELSSLLSRAVEKRPVRQSPHELMFLNPADYAPRVAFAGILVVLFGVIVGPGLFLYIRRRNNKAASTRLFPLLGATSLATLGAMLLLGRAFAPSRHTTTTVVRDLTSGDPNGRIVQTRVFHSPSDPVRVTRSIPGSLLGEDASGSGSSQRGAFRLEGDGNTIVLNEQRPSVSDYVYIVEAASEPLPGGKPITISCTDATCTIDNASNMALMQARLYTVSRGFIEVGTIDANSKQTVMLTNGNGASYYVNHRSDRPEDQLAMRGGRHVSLIARQSGAPQSTIVQVTCTTTCEVAR